MRRKKKKKNIAQSQPALCATQNRERNERQVGFYKQDMIFLCIVAYSVSHAQLCGPMNCRPPGSSVHGILQARILEWVATSSSGGIPDPLTCLLRNLYAGQEATVRTGHGTTDWF